MTRMIETTAKLVEDAIEIALKELDADRDEVEIDVISRGRPGILGLGSEPAKVRITLLDKPPDVVTATSEILHHILSLMNVSAVVNLKSVEREDLGGPVFDVEGEDAGLLIGRRGETVKALEFLVRYLVSRKLGERVNLMIDVEGYQDRRMATLNNLAARVAQRVIRSQRPISLEPMPANERRIIHMALSDNDLVITESEGVGLERKVVVQLK